MINDGRALSVQPSSPLTASTTYSIVITPALRGIGGEEAEERIISFETKSAALSIANIRIDDIAFTHRVTEVSLLPTIRGEFNFPVSLEMLSEHIHLVEEDVVDLNIALSEDFKSFSITPIANLRNLQKHSLRISPELTGNQGEDFQGFERTFYTTAEGPPDFPEIPDDDLLTLVQRQTFRYFWEFAHPASGMARERNTSGDVVTTGGTGFGLMAIIVGIERGFITRQEGIDRIRQVVDFLTTADRFHGAWPHWLNGQTGKAIPFSADDDGGDLVETSFLIQGLLTVRQYLNVQESLEAELVSSINLLWESVKWDWYTQGGQPVLYWHWSPRVGWKINLPIRGYNETLITYFLAAASPTHPIASEVYHRGYARSGAIKNGKSFYNIQLPLGEDYGGPLFFTHYSFLGLNPKDLRDQYADYWQQNVNHTLIQHAYAITNPKNYVGYSDQNWGLTASDNPSGYSAHSPLNDLGVISPTAALSAFPYTPQHAMKALRFFYYQLGDRLWGRYGFYDAFNTNEGWYAKSYLAIDQGPIILMIENYRTQLLWNLLMSAPELTIGKTRLNFY